MKGGGVAKAEGRREGESIKEGKGRSGGRGGLGTNRRGKE